MLELKLDLQAGDSSSTQTPTTSSFSFPSEPPHIGNWFSSYVYESPPDTTGYAFPSSSLEDSQVCTKGFTAAEISGEKEREAQKSSSSPVVPDVVLKREEALLGDDEAENTSSQMSGSSCSKSILSEPPGLTIWFPSYAYESPEVDSDGFAAPGDSQNMQEKYVIKESNEYRKALGEDRTRSENNEVDLEENVALTGRVKCREAATYSQDENQSPHKGIDLAGGRKKSPNRNLVRETLSSKCLNEVIGIKQFSLDHEDEKLVTEEVKICSKDEMVDIATYKGSRASPRRESDAIRSGQEMGEAMVDDASINISRLPSNDRENAGLSLVENGFISTRNRSKEGTGAGVPKRKGVKHGSLRNVAVPVPGKGDGVLQRKPLSERINLQCSGEPEIVGRWRCPQKSKPNLGPPLKQLRLERWVRRV